MGVAWLSFSSHLAKFAVSIFQHSCLHCFQILLNWPVPVISCGPRCFPGSDSSVSLQCLISQNLCHSLHQLQCYPRCSLAASIHCISSAATNFHVCCEVRDLTNSAIQLFDNRLSPRWCPPVACTCAWQTATKFWSFELSVWDPLRISAHWKHWSPMFACNDFSFSPSPSNSCAADCLQSWQPIWTLRTNKNDVSEHSCLAAQSHLLGIIWKHLPGLNLMWCVVWRAPQGSPHSHTYVQAVCAAYRDHHRSYRCDVS